MPTFLNFWKSLKIDLPLGLWPQQKPATLEMVDGTEKILSPRLVFNSGF